MDSAPHSNTWLEISVNALAHNVGKFRELAGEQQLMCVVKANAYGHGMVEVARVVRQHGADWLGVFGVNEGLALRAAGIDCPILVLGPSTGGDIPRGVAANLRLTIASVHGASDYAKHAGPGGLVHLKLETGTHRQGVTAAELTQVLEILQQCGATVEGAYTHYADIEDTTDHTFANQQLDAFKGLMDRIRDAGVPLPLPHTACTAATILFPNTYFSMVRVGIGTYGLWPSKETNVSAHALGRNQLGLQPVMTWKTRIAQIKEVPAGGFVGYGRTFRATRDCRIAILPVGYADGYSRALSGGANTLVRGMRARVTGRICMNLTMVDVTDIPDAAAGDEVILLGKDRDESVSAEDLASLAGTINYEIVTRAAPGAPRIVTK